MANTWGSLKWGQGVWGDASSSAAAVTGISLNATIGDLAFAGPGEGWGRSTWNQGAWGVTGDVFVNSFSLSASLGSISVDAKVEQGWGRGAWGNRAWGDTFSAQAQGQALASSIGNVTPQANADVTVSGLDLLTITQGLNSIQIDSSIFVFVGEDAMTLSQGSQSLVQSTVESPATAGLLQTSVGNTIAGLKLEVPVTGIQASLSLGTFSLQQSTVESATGQAMALGLGTPTEIPGQVIGLTGFGLTSSLGSTTQTGTGNISLTGIDLTASIGSVNITPWQEIDPGVNNVWTEVDRAA
tara:strand:+ start:90 stop:983 length:894 start_codon:yes stop_codon:yes gene_type:complete